MVPILTFLLSKFRPFLKSVIKCLFFQCSYFHSKLGTKLFKRCFTGINFIQIIWFLHKFRKKGLSNLKNFISGNQVYLLTFHEKISAIYLKPQVHGVSRNWVVGRRLSQNFWKSCLKFILKSVCIVNFTNQSSLCNECSH